MARWKNDSGEVIIKVAISGQPGSGKSSIIRSLAKEHAQATVSTGIISEAEVLRTEFLWPDPIPSGPYVRVKVFALSGNPLHQAAEQLLLKDADALVFVVDCDPECIAESRDYLVSLISNAGHVELDWTDTSVAVQYNRSERYPYMNVAEVDAWLEVEHDQVSRYVTTSDEGEGLTVAVNDVIRKTVSRLAEQMKESSSPKKLDEGAKDTKNAGDTKEAKAEG